MTQNTIDRNINYLKENLRKVSQIIDYYRDKTTVYGLIDEEGKILWISNGIFNVSDKNFYISIEIGLQMKPRKVGFFPNLGNKIRNIGRESCRISKLEEKSMMKTINDVKSDNRYIIMEETKRQYNKRYGFL
jgi:hypothetical protein